MTQCPKLYWYGSITDASVYDTEHFCIQGHPSLQSAHCALEEIIENPEALPDEFIFEASVENHDAHPLLQEKYTGLETARLWKPFFLSFLAKTKREQPLPGQVYGEIWPHSLQFWLHNFSNFWVKIGALVRPHLSSWTGFDLPIISGVKFWWFSFF